MPRCNFLHGFSGADAIIATAAAAALAKVGYEPPQWNCTSELYFRFLFFFLENRSNFVRFSWITFV